MNGYFVKASQKKNDDAFNQIISRYGRRVYGYAMQKTGDKELSKAIVVNVFAKIKSYRDALAGIDSVEELIGQIVEKSVAEAENNINMTDINDAAIKEGFPQKKTIISRPERREGKSVLAAQGFKVFPDDGMVDNDAQHTERLYHTDDLLADEKRAVNLSDGAARNDAQIKETRGGPKHASKHRAGSFFKALAVIMMIVVILILIWLIAGLLMDQSILPQYDLGYGWFNANIAHLFGFVA